MTLWRTYARKPYRLTRLIGNDENNGRRQRRARWPTCRSSATLEKISMCCLDIAMASPYRHHLLRQALKIRQAWADSCHGGVMMAFPSANIRQYGINASRVGIDGAHAGDITIYS